MGSKFEVNSNFNIAKAIKLLYSYFLNVYNRTLLSNPTKVLLDDDLI